MTVYRLFILDMQDNLVSGVTLETASDREAMEWSSQILFPERIGELWCGTRCVGRIRHSGACQAWSGTKYLSTRVYLEDSVDGMRCLAAH